MYTKVQHQLRSTALGCQEALLKNILANFHCTQQFFLLIVVADEIDCV